VVILICFRPSSVRIFCGPNRDVGLDGLLRNTSRQRQKKKKNILIHKIIEFHILIIIFCKSYIINTIYTIKSLRKKYKKSTLSQLEKREIIFHVLRTFYYYYFYYNFTYSFVADEFKRIVFFVVFTYWYKPCLSYYTFERFVFFFCFVF
jgi:hypothetical protein